MSNANLKSGLLVKTQPSTIVVTVRGPSTALTTAGRSMRATLDLKGLGLGHYTVVPRITAPHNLQILGVYPPRVNVTLSKSH